jgi:CRP-like cAMP-binding protein
MRQALRQTDTTKLSLAAASRRGSTPGIFRGLGAHEITVIRHAAVRRTFAESEVIISAEDPALRLFLPEIGQIDYFILTHDGSQLLLRRLGPGDPFGFAAFLSEPVGYLGTARSVGDSEMLVWEHHIIRHLGRSYPRLVENSLRIALDYIALYAKRHIAIVSNTAQERVACVLASLGARLGHALPEGLQVEVKNEDLASLSDVNFFTVSRILKHWEQQGTITKARGKVLIRRPEDLLAE